MTATCPNCESTFRGVDRNEDGSPDIEATRCALPGCETYLCQGTCQELSFQCEGCTKRFCNAHKYIEDGLPYCLSCVIAGIEAQEPACECQQTDVDMFDPRGCEAHDSSSAWNARLRAVTAVQEYDALLATATAPVTEASCPF